MTTDKKQFLIECYDIVQIIFQLSERLKTMTLIKIHYVADFMITAVSDARLNEKDVHFDE